MKEATNHPFMDYRTVKAWETSKGGYVHVYDVRDLYHNFYIVEKFNEHGGMDIIYSCRNLERCIAWAMKYAEQN
jgi:hypothetical protein